VSVLRDRIVGRGATDNDDAAAHPYGTAATPMTMPLAHVQYGADEVALYGTLHPLVTADGAVIPAHSQAYIHQPWPAPVAPAGRP
jgi:hypothetical protein